MFGSPMEDGRVVGSGSPPRENGKVDREIGLPPVLAAADSRYIGQRSEALPREIIEESSLCGIFYEEFRCVSRQGEDTTRERERGRETKGRDYCFLNSLSSFHNFKNFRYVGIIFELLELMSLARFIFD